MSRRASGVSVRSAPAPRWNTIRSSIFVVLLISPASAQYCRDSLLAAALVTPGTGVGLDAALGPDVALLGAPGDDALGSDAGAVIVYALDSATPTVVDAQPWRASDGAGGDFFGASVAVDGDVAVIGAPGRDAMGVPDIGAAYVFRRVGGHWAEEQQLLPSTFGTDLRFGRDLDLSGDRIIVGHRLGAVVFRWNGATWAEEVTLGSDGRDVSIDGTFAACRSGLYSYDAAASSWVLELTGLSWEQVSVDDDVFLVYRGGITVDIYRRDPLTGTWPVVQSFGTPSATPFHAELSAGMLLYVVSGHLSVSAPVTGASILNLGPFMGGVSFTGPAAAWNGRVLAASSGPACGVLSDVRCYQDVINTTFCSAATNSTGGPGHLDVVGAREVRSWYMGDTCDRGHG